MTRSVQRRAVLVLCILLGGVVGAAGFTFTYAQGTAYLTDDPAACANCHVMTEQYAGWRKASHHTVAVCNDCHAPEGFLGKYATKALNGWNHSVAFTTGDFPEPIRITPRNREITEGQCRSCHVDVVQAIDPAPAPRHAPASGTAHSEEDRPSCIRCHRSVGHPED
ncbi:cytochrome c nitrite reductase small subunit [Hyalangium sp.]|uniref:cytochrome c nitrite reductase small subunit n=1 Tax=Hyalangium sp. TaxID=2028555 RepID=UPI002D5C5CEE|nr:cytochrome c nitrite reductase small subunit [Hyalangium sp.]HYI01005.1 cytochrome c nitrite reductase small subunit [Hyalangium sp.]